MIPRAERFPSVVKLRMEGVPGEVRYVRERTCRRMPSDDATVMVKRGCFEMEFPFFECSECGSYVMDNARYCPICGARVVW